MKLAFHPATPEKYRDASRLRATPMSFGHDLHIAEFLDTKGNRRGVEGITMTPGTVCDVVFHIAVDTRDEFIESEAGAFGLAPLVIARSGLGSCGLTLTNGTGLIDADYTKFLRGRLELAAWAEPLYLQQWDRVAQLLIVPTHAPVFVVVDTLPDTGRGGFGSTGVA